MKIYLVGGAVRDALMGLSVSDRDWVVVGSTPEEMLRRGFRQVGRDFPVFLHPETHEEYALARTERKTGPRHVDFDCDASPKVSLEEDLVRRDLTINAIARDEAGRIIDPFGGARDITDGILRHVSDAFREDPLRYFRVARFASRFPDFRIDPDTLGIMRSMQDELNNLPAERVWGETQKALALPGRVRYFEVLQQVAPSHWFEQGFVAHCTELFRAREFSSGELAATGIAWNFDEQSIVRHYKHLKVDRETLLSSRDLARHGAALTIAGKPGRMLDALGAIGAFRPGNRWRRVLAARAEASGEDSDELVALTEALAAMRVDAPPGPEYGKSLHAARREYVDKMRTRH